MIGHLCRIRRCQCGRRVWIIRHTGMVLTICPPCDNPKGGTL